GSVAHRDPRGGGIAAHRDRRCRPGRPAPGGSVLGRHVNAVAPPSPASVRPEVARDGIIPWSNGGDVVESRVAASMPTPGSSRRDRTARNPALLEIVADIARRLEQRQTVIAEAVTTRLANDIDLLAADPQLNELLGDSVYSNLTTILHVLANDIPLQNLHPPTAAVEYARRLAQREVP